MQKNIKNNSIIEKRNGSSRISRLESIWEQESLELSIKDRKNQVKRLWH